MIAALDGCNTTSRAGALESQLNTSGDERTEKATIATGTAKVSVRNELAQLWQQVKKDWGEFNEKRNLAGFLKSASGQRPPAHAVRCPRDTQEIARHNTSLRHGPVAAQALLSLRSCS